MVRAAGGGARAPQAGAGRLPGPARQRMGADHRHRGAGRPAGAAHRRAGRALGGLPAHPWRGLGVRHGRHAGRPAGAAGPRVRARLRLRRVPARARGALPGRAGRLRGGGAVARPRGEGALRHGEAPHRRRVGRGASGGGDADAAARPAWADALPGREPDGRVLRPRPDPQREAVGRDQADPQHPRHLPLRAELPAPEGRRARPGRLAPAGRPRRAAAGAVHGGHARSAAGRHAVHGVALACGRQSGGARRVAGRRACVHRLCGRADRAGAGLQAA